MQIQYGHPKSERTVGLWLEAISAFVPACVVPWVGFQKQEHAERLQSLSVFSVSQAFSASTDFLCFFVMHNPWPIPQCRALPSNRMIHTVNTCFHLMVRSCSKRKTIKPAARQAGFVLVYRKTFFDNRGNESDSYRCCFFGNLHLVQCGAKSGII